MSFFTFHPTSTTSNGLKFNFHLFFNVPNVKPNATIVELNGTIECLNEAQNSCVESAGAIRSNNQYRSANVAGDEWATVRTFFTSTETK